MTEAIIAIVVVVVLLIALIILTVAVRYKTCPPDKIMIIYGKLRAASDGTYASAKCIHGGAAFVWPFFQKYTFMDLTPLSISVDLKNALSKQNIRIDVPSIFTVGISTEPGIMQNAAERLGMLKLVQIFVLSQGIYRIDKKPAYFQLVHHSSSRLYFSTSISGLSVGAGNLFCSFRSQFLIAACQFFMGVLPTRQPLLS